MKVSVLIPTYHNPDKVKRCINSLVHQIRIPEEVIIVFDSEDVETKSVISTFQNLLNIIPVPLKRMGKMTKILNAGIKQTSGEIIAFLDEDVSCDKEWLSRITSEFKDGDVVACGGKDVIICHGKKVLSRETNEIGILKWKGYIVGNQYRGAKKREVMFLKGCNMAVKRKYLHKLNENLIGFVRWEQDIFFKLLETKKKIIYDPEIKVYHFKDNREYLKPSWTYWYGHNTVYLFMKYLKGMKRCLAILFYFLIGDSSSPGYFRFVFYVVNRNENSFCSFATSQIAKIKGLFTFLR